MADVNHGAVSVHVTNLLESGFHEAMTRVAESGFVVGSTLVDLIPQSEWDAWDARSEMALVMDSEGMSPTEIDDDCYPQAA